MAIVVGELKIALRGQLLGEQWQVIQWYRPDGAAFLTADVLQVGEAWWNDVKSAVRALFNASSVLTCQSVFVAEPGASGAYGEYPVPGAEQQGTRAAGSDFSPPFEAFGFRETVGTRATRPGQKRFPGVMEVDANNGVLTGTALALVTAVAAKFCNPIILGAPVALGVLTPLVVRLEGSPEAITVSQEVTGYLVNANVTTQNSRKYGRGS